MKYLLVRYCEDWADEFDLEATKVFTETEFDNFQDKLEGPVEVYGGLGNVDASNDYGTKGEFLNTLGVEEITKEEYDIIKKLDLEYYNCDALDLD